MTGPENGGTPIGNKKTKKGILRKQSLLHTIKTQVGLTM